MLVWPLCQLPSDSLLNGCPADHTRVISCNWSFFRQFCFKHIRMDRGHHGLAYYPDSFLYLSFGVYQKYSCFKNKYLCRFNCKFMSVIQVPVTRLLSIENPKGMNVLNSSDHNAIGNNGFLVEINRRSSATISDAGGVLKKIKTERSLLGAFAVFDAIFFFWTVWLAQ